MRASSQVWRHINPNKGHSRTNRHETRSNRHGRLDGRWENGPPHLSLLFARFHHVYRHRLCRPVGHHSPSPPCRLNAAARAPMTWRSRLCTAASATPTSTRRETNGGIAVYPLMPGHEIVGKVTAVGASVTAHKVGDLVGVGCMVDSCRHCEACKSDLEQYCPRRPDHDLRHAGSCRWQQHHGRLLRQHRGQRALCGEDSGQARPGQRRADPVRRHYHLLAAQALRRKGRR